MAAAHTTTLEYLGKYVSFNTDSAFEISGVISSIVFNMDGSIDFSIGWDHFFSLSEISNLKILGEVKLY